MKLILKLIAVTQVFKVHCKHKLQQTHPAYYKYTKPMANSLTVKKHALPKTTLQLQCGLIIVYITNCKKCNQKTGEKVDICLTPK